MFYDRFLELCAAKNESPSGVVKKIGLSNAAASGWKNGKAPSQVTLVKLANYFGVTPDYLLGNVSEPWFYLDNEKTLRWANSYEEDPDLDQQLSGIDFALSGEIHDLTDAEKQDILDYIRFKKSQRGGGNK